MNSSPYSELSDREWNDLSELVCDIRISWLHYLPETQQKCCRSLKKLLELCDLYRFKLPIVDQSLKVLPLLKTIIETSSNPEMRNSALSCIWYLSRHHEIYAIIGSRSLGILSLCMRLLRYENSDAAYKTLRNCAFDCAVHPYLLSEELGYLEFFREEMIQFPLSVYPYHVFSAISSALQESCVHYFIQWRIPEMVYSRLLQAGVDPKRWEGLEFGIEDHSLTFLSCLSALPTGRKLLRSLQPFDFFYHVSLSKTTEGSRSLVILINLYGEDLFQYSPDLSPSVTPAFEHRQLYQLISSFKNEKREILRTLTRYWSWLVNGSDCPYKVEIAAAGYEYGSIMLRELIYFYQQLLLFPDIEGLKVSLLREGLLVPILVKIMKEFSTKKGFTMPNLVGQIYCGGGWKDSLSLQYTLQIFFQFFIDFEVSRSSDFNDRQSFYSEELQNILPEIVQSSRLAIVVEETLEFLRNTSRSLPIDNRELLMGLLTELQRRVSVCSENSTGSSEQTVLLGNQTQRLIKTVV